MSKRNFNSEEPKKTPATAAGAPESEMEMLRKLHQSVETLSGNVEKTLRETDNRISGIDERLIVVERKLGLCKEPDASETTTPTEDPKKTQEKSEGETKEKSEGEACTNGPKSEKTKCVIADGVRKAFRYQDLKTKFVYVVADRWAAKQAGNGEYDEIWAYYKNGQIDHVLSPEEIREIFAI